MAPRARTPRPPTADADPGTPGTRASRDGSDRARTDVGPRAAVLITEQLSKTFSHGGLQQHVLRNLNLRIEAGSFTVVMGP